MGDLQATFDGTEVDNGTWRRIVDMSDAIGDEYRRVVVVDFSIHGDTKSECMQRYNATREALLKVNARFTATTDDDSGVFFADMAPNDGQHTETRATLEWTPGETNTGYQMNCTLTVYAAVTPVNAGGGASSGTVTTFDGVAGSIRKVTHYGPGRVQDRSFLATFVSTIEYSGGTLTFTSVENSGGFARFVLDSGGSAPTAFAAGMRIEVLTTNGGYIGRHVVTAVDVAAKKITVETAYGATAAGTLKQGDLVTGRAHYEAQRSDILEDVMGTDSDGSRNASTGLALSLEKVENADGDDQSYTVLLQSEVESYNLSDVPSSRKNRIVITETRPDRWHRRGGTKPVYLLVEGEIYCDMTVISTASLHDVFEAAAQANIEAAVRAETGEAVLRPLQIKIESTRREGLVKFSLLYQARNASVISATLSTSWNEGPNHIEFGAGKFNYLQRPETLRPKDVTVTATRTGRGRVALACPVPPGDGGGTYHELSTSYAEDGPYDSDFGEVWIQSKTVIYRRYRFAAGGVGV